MKNSANGVQIYKVLMMMYSSTDQLQGPLIQSLEYSPPPSHTETRFLLHHLVQTCLLYISSAYYMITNA